MRLQLGVAKELGYTLQQLNQSITIDELFLWSAYFELCNDEQEAEMKRQRLRR